MRVRLLSLEREKRARAQILRTRRSVLSAPVADRLARVTSRRILNCFGDSHAVVFRYMSHRRLLPHTILDVMEVRGAAARGLSNPHSATMARARFMQAISRLPPDRPILTLVGEIDCGSLIWDRATQRATAPEQELKGSVASYLEMLDAVAKGGHTSLIVSAVPYPTLEKYTNERAHVTATLDERMSMTKAFNDELRQWCDRHAAAYLSYDEVLDRQTGRVRPEFHHKDPRDHHYRTATFAPVLANELKKLGFH
jgi:hypothetical protein